MKPVVIDSATDGVTIVISDIVLSVADDASYMIMSALQDDYERVRSRIVSFGG